MTPLTPAEQEIVDKAYIRFGVLQGTPGEKCQVLQKFIGPRQFHCMGDEKLPPDEFAALELRSNERIYLLGI